MQGILRKSFVIMIAAIIITAGFGLTLEPASAVTGPTSITIKADFGTTTYGYVDYNGQVRIALYSVYPAGRIGSVTWSVYSGGSYGKIVSKTSTYCYVQGIKYGTVIIKAKSNYYPYPTKYIKMYVRSYTPTAVTVSPDPLSMWTGTSAVVKASVARSFIYNAGVAWTSSQTGVAQFGTSISRTTGGPTVSGTITANSLTSGTTTITARTLEYSRTDTAKVDVYHAYLTSERVNMDAGTTLTNPNPITVMAPDKTTPANTITYTSSSDVVAVDANGNLTASDTKYGSAVITAKVKVGPIATTKDLTYVVNVKKPVDTSFTFDDDWGYLELTHNSDGFMGDTTLRLDKGQLDDLFGFGSLGMDLWNPMDMYMNFQATDIIWHAGDFAFDKVKSSVATDPDVEISTNSPLPMPKYHTYWLDDTAGDGNCVDLAYDSGGLATGYSLKFYRDDYIQDAAYDEVALLGNKLSVKFYSVDIIIERLGYNKVQILADADLDSEVDDIVLTMTRTTTGVDVVIDNPTYMNNQGINFSLYDTYL